MVHELAVIDTRWLSLNQDDVRKSPARGETAGSLRVVSPRSMIRDTCQPVAEEITECWDLRIRLATSTHVVEETKAHQSSAKKYSAEGITREGIARQGMWRRKEVNR